MKDWRAAAVADDASSSAEQMKKPEKWLKKQKAADVVAVGADGTAGRY